MCPIKLVLQKEERLESRGEEYYRKAAMDAKGTDRTVGFPG
jgi:hypothetical protein